MVYIKSMMRRSVRVVLLALLIALLSFAFISRVVEYVVINGEIGRLGGYYRSIGTLSRYSADNWDVSEGVDLISSSDMVLFEDLRRYSSGVMHGLHNTDIDGFSSDLFSYPFRHGYHVSDVWFTGVVANDGVTFDASRGDYGAYVFLLVVDDVIAGYPEYIKAGELTRVFHPLQSPDTGENPLEGIKVGERYFIKAFFDPGFFLGFFRQSNWETVCLHLIQKPLDDEGMWYIPLEANEKMDMGAPGREELKAELEILLENQSAVLLVATRDMSSMPNTQQKSRDLYIAEGRWLTLDDDLQARSVCAIHSEFAERRGLSLGDTLTMTVRDFGERDVYYGYIPGKEMWGSQYVPDNWENWRDFPTEDISFEIVGIYGEVEPDYYGDTLATLSVYIPGSVLPEGYNSTETVYPGSYSFVLKSSRDQDAFVHMYRDALSDMGITLTFIGVDAAPFWSSVTPIQQSTLLNLIVFSSIALIGFAFVVFIYLRIGRKEFAILRVLGSPVRRARRSAIIPVTIIALIGILAGGITSWGYALGKAAEVLSGIELPEGAESSASLPQAWLVLLCVGLFVLTLVMVWAGICIMTRGSVLDILLGAQGKQTGYAMMKQEYNIDTVAAGYMPSQAGNTAVHRPVYPQTPTRRHKIPPLVFSVRFVRRHICRSFIKSLLTILLAAGFVLVLGWMTHTIEVSRNEAVLLMDTVTVELDIVKKNPLSVTFGRGSVNYGAFINKRLADTILESGFVIEHELRSGIILDYWGRAGEPISTEGETKRNQLTLTTSTDIEALFEYYGISGAQVEYVKSWTEAMVFEMEWSSERILRSKIPVVFPTSLLESNNLKAGDTVSLGYTDAPGTANGIGFISPYVIAGQYDDMYVSGDILMPLGALEALHEYMEIDMIYSYAHFVLDPLKNHDLPDFSKQVEEWISAYWAGTLPLRAIFWDEELHLVVSALEQTVELLNMLFPITVAVATLFAGGLSVLLLLTTAKEAAYLRVLGATKARVRATLSSQQALLALIGLLLGHLGINMMQGFAAPDAGISLTLCAALYMCGTVAGAALASAVMTRRSPLDLLQVKE